MGVNWLLKLMEACGHGVGSADLVMERPNRGPATDTHAAAGDEGVRSTNTGRRSKREKHGCLSAIGRLASSDAAHPRDLPHGRTRQSTQDWARHGGTGLVRSLVSVCASRRGALRALGVAVLACAVLLTGLLAAGSASAQTTNADGSVTLWEATLTVGQESGGTLTGYNLISGFGSLSSNTFTHDGSTRTIGVMATTTDNKLALRISPKVNDISNATLHIGSEEFAFADATPLGTDIVQWSNLPSWSNGDEIAVKLTQAQKPSAPRLSAQGGSRRIDLSWSAKTGGSPITGYKIEVSIDGTDGSWTDLVENTTETTYSHTRLAASTRRYYRVSATNAIGTGPTSRVAWANPAALVPEVDALWSETLTPADFSVSGNNYTGFDEFQAADALDNNSFTYGDVSITISRLARRDSRLFFTLAFEGRCSILPATAWPSLTLVVDGTTELPFPNLETLSSCFGVNIWKDVAFTWMAGEEVDVKIVAKTGRTTVDERYPELSVQGGEVRESGTPGVTSDMTFTVSVDLEPDFPVGVHYETEDGTATGGASCSGSSPPDYISTEGRFTLGPGKSSHDVVVTVCDDTVQDSGETLRLVLRSTQLHESIEEIGTIGPEGKSYKNENGEDEETASSTGTILNDETTTEVSIVADAAYAEEGTDAAFTVRRAGDAEGALTVPVSVVEDGAVLGTPVPASVTFAAGSRQAALRVATDDDGADEADSTVTATLQTGADWLVAEGAASATLTVLDNDAAPVPAVSAAGVTIWSADMTVVDYQNGNIGAGSAGLLANQGGSAGLQVKWLYYHTGERKLKLSFNDGLDDAESLTLHMGGVSLGFPENSGGDSSFSLEDVDIAWTDGETIAVRVSKPSTEAVSTDAMLASLTVDGATLSPAFDAGVLVYRAVVDAGVEMVTVAASAKDGGAAVTYGPAADSDVELADHQVTAPVGETLTTVTVTAADGQTQRAYRVVVKRWPTVAVSFGSGSYTATEGGDAATVAVTLSADPGRDVTIPLTASPAGGAAADDYTVPGSVTFTSGGALSQTVVVTAVADDTAEEGERVVLSFGPLPDRVEAGTTSSAAVTLVDEAPNAAPTGVPSISGTAQAGETLTASVESIEDADGLTGASFAYQWVSNDGTADEDVADATQDTYLVAAEDEGKTLKVRVTFTDDRGTEESLLSVATEEVTVPLTASFEDVPAEHDGSSMFTFRVRFNLEPKVGFRVLRDESFAVTGGTVKKARRVNGRNDLREIHVKPSGMGDVTVTLAGGRACGTEGAICTADDKVLSNTLTATVQGPPALNVADARVEEGADATLDFVVTLSRAASGAVTVDYATADGSATAGADYTTASGTLTFASGTTEQRVSVPVLDDVVDDGGETLTLTLSNASGAWVEDGTATGTIENSDPMPKAWLARFGRTVGTHVTDAVGERLRGSPGQDSHLTVGGYRLPLNRDESGAARLGPDEPAAKADSLASLVTGLAGVLGLGSVGTGPVVGPAGVGLGPDPLAEQPDQRLGQSQTLNLDMRRILLGSSFRLSLGADDTGSAGPRLTAWGRVAGTRFDGRDGNLTLNGDVLTGTLGVDGEWDRLLAGVAVAHSRGDGSYTRPGIEDRGHGDLDKTLTSIHPYLRYAVTDQLDVWGMLGYGWGELTLAQQGAASLETDTDFVMGAFGGRGILLSARETGGFQLATRTDAMLTRTTSEAVTGLASSEADAHRLRLILEGSRGFTWAEGRSLTPTMEVGLRHDWGDAETGFGLELGGRVQYADPSLGLTIEGAVRGLLAHEDSDYGEWGASGSLRIAPGAGGQGLALAREPRPGAPRRAGWMACGRGRRPRAWPPRAPGRHQPAA